MIERVDFDKWMELYNQAEEYCVSWETDYAGDEIKNGNTIIPLKYMPERFYQQVMDYGEVGWDILRAMDEGTEEDVKRELCKYIKDNEYNEELCEYINGVNWL